MSKRRGSASSFFISLWKLCFLDLGAGRVCLCGWWDPAAFEGLLSKILRSVMSLALTSFGKEAALYAGLQHATETWWSGWMQTFRILPVWLLEMKTLLGPKCRLDCVGTRRTEWRGEPFSAARANLFHRLMQGLSPVGSPFRSVIFVWWCYLPTESNVFSKGLLPGGF